MKKQLILALYAGAMLAANPPVEMITSQGTDGEIPGWKSFHESPGIKTGDVWRFQPDGILVCKGQPKGYLYTEKDYTDFALHFEWRYPPGAKSSNGGVLVRMTGAHAIWPKCLELQLNQGQAGDFWAIRGYEMSGAAERLKTITNSPFGVLHHLKRLVDAEKPAGEWNQHEVVVEGGAVTQKLNGVLVNQAMGCEVLPGKILLTAEGQEIEFRKLHISVKQ